MTACCAEVRVALSLWDVRTDLPERVAVHVAGCPGCRAEFDVRFVVVPLPAEPADPAVRERLLGRERPVALRAAPLLLVAAVLVGLGLGLVTSADGRDRCAVQASNALSCEDVAFGEPLDQECSAG
jgi:hypothetical protein